MKTTTARKRKNVGCDTAAEVDHLLSDFLQPRMIEHHKDAAGFDRRAFLCAREAAGNSSIFERSVIRSVVGELPAEQLLEEISRRARVRCLELDVIDLIVRAHIRVCSAKETGSQCAFTHTRFQTWSRSGKPSFFRFQL